MKPAPRSPIAIFASEDDPQVTHLRAAMDDFYATTTSYNAFQSIAHKGDEWPHVLEAIDARLKDSIRLRVLEFGAGRSGFGDFLGEVRPSVELTAQDVTPANAEFLRTQANHVCIGPIEDVAGSFDVIFSTFVLEHLSDPRATLERLFGMLAPGGVLLIFCPRYDFPFYLSRSADHYTAGKRFRIGLRVLFRRLWTLIGGQPAFLIHLDPAVFHLPFVNDRDAIHWVSLFDLRAFFRGRASLRKLTVYSGGISKQWLVKKFLTVNLAITKPNLSRHG